MESRKKTRPQDDPYEIWIADSPNGPWEWRVLKFYSEKNSPGQRVLVAVKSPYTFGEYEIGDDYYITLKRLATCVPKGKWGQLGKRFK